MEEGELKKIRKRWEEYSPAHLSAYKAFMFEAHADVGKLLEEVDRLRELEGAHVRQILGAVPEKASEKRR